MHIAFIMNGNRRWAKKNNCALYKGYTAGLENMQNITKLCLDKAKELTFYAFSTENWSRPSDEKKILWLLLKRFIVKSLKSKSNFFNQNNIKVRFIGDISAFGSKMVNKMQALEEQTKHNNALTINIAINYSGRQDIVNAVNKILQANLEKIKVEEFQKYMYTNYMSNPDIMIRCGGEYRLSNFLLWDMAYTELFFTKSMWPDFSEEELYNIIKNFKLIKRSYGK